MIELIDRNDKRYEERWIAQEKAAENLKEYQNEFRGALDDVSTKQATKVELNTAIKTLSDKIDVQAGLLSDLRSRLDVGNPAISALQNQQAISKGILQGSDITMNKIYAAMVAVAAVITVIILLATKVL